MFRRAPRSLIVATLVTLFLAGCRKDPANEPTNKADSALERFLNAWVHNESPDQFGGNDKPIRGTDPDWQSGHRLLTFLIVDSKTTAETPPRIRCRVALSLQEKSGKKVEKEVVYDVQLGEPVNISRAKP